MTSTRTVSASACFCDVAQRLARDAVDERVAARAGADASSTCSSVSMPSAPQRAEQVAAARPRARSTRGSAGGSRRAACAGRARPGAAVEAVALSSRASRSSPRRSALSASGASPKATPARSWTTPSCRSEAIRRRSWLGGLDRVRRAGPRGRGGRAAGAGPSTRRAGPGRAAARAGRRSAAARARAAAGVALALHRARTLVDLEEHRRAVRRADRRVRLEQLALLALVPVLGLGEVAELGLGAALLEASRAPPSPSSKRLPISAGSSEYRTVPSLRPDS